MQVCTLEATVKKTNPTIVRKSTSPDFQNFTACRQKLIKAIEFYLRTIIPPDAEKAQWEKVGKIQFEGALRAAKKAGTYGDIVSAIKLFSQYLEVQQKASSTVKLETPEASREVRDMFLLTGAAVFGEGQMREIPWSTFCSKQ